jgi:hypothetical protein
VAKAVGYAGRRRALDAIAAGHKAYAMISSPPNGEHVAGAWFKYLGNSERVYPVLAVDSEDSGDKFAILGKPVDISVLRHAG